MKRIALLVLVACLFVVPSFAATLVEIDTNYGKITVELDEVKAPKTVANFLAYIDAKH